MLGYTIRKTKVGDLEVSTCKTPFGYIETMVFNDRTGDTDVRPEFTRRHADHSTATLWHEHVVEAISV